MTCTESEVVRSRPRLVTRTMISEGRAWRRTTSRVDIHAPLARAKVVVRSTARTARVENPYWGIWLPLEVRPAASQADPSVGASAPPTSLRQSIERTNRAERPRLEIPLLPLSRLL